MDTLKDDGVNRFSCDASGGSSSGKKDPPGKSVGTLLDRSTLNYGGIIQVQSCFHAFLTASFLLNYLLGWHLRASSVFLQPVGNPFDEIGWCRQKTVD